MTPPLSTDTVRASLGERYEPRRLIAVGGMGEVWRATDQVLQRDVACKVLKAEFADDEGFRSRFLNEARAAASLHHPGIAGIFDFGERSGQRPYLVMELVDGAPLTDALRRGPLHPDDAREVVAQVAEALGEAHDRGLVHRDIKPGNILVERDGRAKLTDFGIARAADGLDLTRTGEIIGTPTYLSPEQAQGDPATPASDVYALGVVLHECLTGRRPFQADGPVATALAHIRQPVPELPDDVPADLAAITHRAMAKDPADRYPDARTLALALRAAPAVAHGVSVPPTAAGTVSAAAIEQADGSTAAAAPAATRLITAPGTPAPVAATMSAPPAPAEHRRRRPPLPVLLMLGLAGVLALALVVNAVTDSGPSQPAAAEPSATPSPSNAATKTVVVDPKGYLGKPDDEVARALEKLGLKARGVGRTNPGGKVPGTVAALRPTGRVPVGTTITLSVWRKAPPPPTTEKPDDKGGDQGAGDTHKGKPDHAGKPGKGKKK